MEVQKFPLCFHFCLFSLIFQKKSEKVLDIFKHFWYYIPAAKDSRWLLP